MCLVLVSISSRFDADIIKISELKFSDKYIAECATSIKEDYDLLQKEDGGINDYISILSNISKDALIKGDEHDALLMFISNACVLQRKIAKGTYGYYLEGKVNTTIISLSGLIGAIIGVRTQFNMDGTLRLTILMTIVFLLVELLIIVFGCDAFLALLNLKKMNGGESNEKK